MQPANIIAAANAARADQARTFWLFFFMAFESCQILKEAHDA
jgi:hypothetical protein